MLVCYSRSVHELWEAMHNDQEIDPEATRGGQLSKRNNAIIEPGSHEVKAGISKSQGYNPPRKNRKTNIS